MNARRVQQEAPTSAIRLAKLGMRTTTRFVRRTTDMRIKDRLSMQLWWKRRKSRTNSLINVKVRYGGKSKKVEQRIWEGEERKGGEERRRCGIGWETRRGGEKRFQAEKEEVLGCTEVSERIVKRVCAVEDDGSETKVRMGRRWRKWRQGKQASAGKEGENELSAIVQSYVGVWLYWSVLIKYKSRTRDSI